ncbi:uncharacterized protein LOC110266160 [Arachis ipaensis]|uniref:uncharacterized protein LOC110266160 n=1 Tax=Arachis ipaensis TaxID=130454 RepID=UPI000A2B4ED2|nr:uncharacterized protein LOC110266160 [Arachis ipaensis]
MAYWLQPPQDLNLSCSCWSLTKVLKTGLVIKPLKSLIFGFLIQPVQLRRGAVTRDLKRATDDGKLATVDGELAANTTDGRRTDDGANGRAFEHGEPGGMANDHDEAGGDGETNGGAMEARIFKEERERTLKEDQGFQGRMALKAWKGREREWFLNIKTVCLEYTGRVPINSSWTNQYFQY